MRFLMELFSQRKHPVFFLVNVSNGINQPPTIVNVTHSISDLKSEKNKNAQYVMIGWRIEKCDLYSGL